MEPKVLTIDGIFSELGRRRNLQVMRKSKGREFQRDLYDGPLRDEVAELHKIDVVVSKEVEKFTSKPETSEEILRTALCDDVLDYLRGRYNFEERFSFDENNETYILRQAQEILGMYNRNLHLLFHRTKKRSDEIANTLNGFFQRTAENYPRIRFAVMDYVESYPRIDGFDLVTMD